MSVRSVVVTALTEYIQNDVDQLCEEVVDIWEMSWGTYDEEEGVDSGVYVNVEYRVPPGVNRFNAKTWRFNGDLLDLIGNIDSWKER